uniref:Uncharacterized protein n=1 Tax=Setaria italica TaxID=4555 RepID=K3Y3S7_SETIT
MTMCISLGNLMEYQGVTTQQHELSSNSIT